MERVSLSAEIREATGKGYANKIRREGKVPAVLYGKGIDNKNLSVDGKKVDKILREHGMNVLVDLDVEGEKNIVMFREVQRDVLTPRILHVDFMKISLDKELETTVPLILTGTPVGITQGGVLQHQLREVDIKALPEKIPHAVEVDISHLKIGESISIGDILKNDYDFEILNDPEEIIAAVVAPKMAGEGEEVEEEAEVAEEAAETPEKEEGEEA